jgi:4-hydroxy-tetrahydrodipicolinate synthase
MPVKSTSQKQLVFTALVTPFTEQNKVNFGQFETLCQDQFSAGISGLVIGGTTGESPTLTVKELGGLTKVAHQLREKSFPDRQLIIGIGTNDTQTTLEKVDQVLSTIPVGNSRRGPDQLMVVLPYYNKPNHEGLFHHLKKIVERQRVNTFNRFPLMIYHVPGRTAYQISAEDLARICRQLLSLYPGSIGAIKDATGKIEYAQRLKELLPSVSVLSGDDSLYLESLLKREEVYGGTVSVLSNVRPKELVDYTRSPKLVDCLNLQTVTRFLFSITSPIPTKYLLSTVGRCTTSCRLPLYIGQETIQRLEVNHREMKAALLSEQNPLSQSVHGHSLGNRICLVPHSPLLENPSVVSLFCQVSANPIDTIVSYEPRAPSRRSGNDYLVRFFNRDGGEVELCGNGLRCLVAHLAQTDSSFTLSNRDGQAYSYRLDRETISVGLGRPQLAVTLHQPPKGLHLSTALPVAWGHVIDIGNPHLVIFVDDLLAPSSLVDLGKRCQEFFPGGVNVELVKKTSPRQVEVQIYERGVGPSQSCGSGCVSAVFAGHHLQLLERNVEVRLERGVMTVELGDDGYFTRAPVEWT